METIPPPLVPGPQKKSMPVIAWVGIGCGGLILLTVIAGVLLVGKCYHKFRELARPHPFHKAAAEMMVSKNPNLIRLSGNDVSGSITFRNKSTGEQLTASYKDIAAGRITIKDASGREIPISSDLSKVPVWVPHYSGLVETTGVYHQEIAGKVEGMFTATTTDPPGDVAAFFKTQAGNLGLNGSSSFASSTNGGNSSLTTSYSGNGRELKVTVSRQSGQPASVDVTYKEQKGKHNQPTLPIL